MKELPGETNRFVIAHKVPGRYNTSQVRMPMQEVRLASLCNNEDKSARIKFTISIPGTNQLLHEGFTTVNDLEAGKTTLQCGQNCTLRLDQFQVRTKPHFTDYLRAGW